MTSKNLGRSRSEWVSPCGRVRLVRGNCLQKLRQIRDIDAIVTDPPYGVIDCAWDVAPPLDELRERLAEASKPKANWVVFATQPFANDLITAWRKLFRYELVWVKNRPVGFLNANRQPMRKHELILLFGRAKGAAVYHPQMTAGKPYKNNGDNSTNVYRCVGKRGPIVNTGTRHPTSVIAIDEAKRGQYHPTQKPVPLLEWLVRSYSDPDDLICDPYSGSATTAIACKNTGRRFIGFERDPKNFKVAVRRLEAAFDGQAQAVRRDVA